MLTHNLFSLVKCVKIGEMGKQLACCNLALLDRVMMEEHNQHTLQAGDYYPPI